MKIQKHIFVYLIVPLLTIIFLNSCSDDDEPIPNQYKLNISVSPDNSGSVNPSEGTYINGTSVKLTGTPTNYYKFKEWKGDVTGTTNPITVLMNSNKSITVVFELKEILTTYVPDDNFEQKLIDLGYDKVLDDYVLTKNIQDVVEIVLEGLEIKDLTGIEDFKSLEKLDCSYNQLTSLNLHKNTELKYLECIDNQLTSLDVSNNKYLTRITCFGNQLTSLDVSNNISLRWLSCGNNQLTSLDLSNNISLTDLSCSKNQLTTLDVSKNTSLNTLSCGENQLTVLDVNNNTTLTVLYFTDNQLTNLDVSNNTSLTGLYCYVNQLTSLNVSKNLSLKWLICSDNQLTSLDVTNNTLLDEFNCYGNQLTSLDVSNNTSLSNLNCQTNPLTCVKVNQTQLDDIPTDWKKDPEDTYSLDCNES